MKSPAILQNLIGEAGEKKKEKSHQINIFGGAVLGEGMTKTAKFLMVYQF